MRKQCLVEVEGRNNTLTRVQTDLLRSENDILRVNTELSWANDQYLVLYHEQLQVKEDYRTSHGKLLRVHDDDRIALSALHEEIDLLKALSTRITEYFNVHCYRPTKQVGL